LQNLPIRPCFDYGYIIPYIPISILSEYRLDTIGSGFEKYKERNYEIGICEPGPIKDSAI